MTEQEAKAKWCPQYRSAIAGQDGGFADNRPLEYDYTQPGAAKPTGSFDAGCRCLGSVCMAWRWESIMAGDDRGFCGLAGKP